MTPEEFARWGWTLLLDASLKSLLLLAVSGLALLCLRRVSAAVRHLILLLTLVCLLCLPLLSGTLPGWHVAVWPHTSPVAPAPSESLPAASPPTAPSDSSAPAMPPVTATSPVLPFPAAPISVRPVHAHRDWSLLGFRLWIVGAGLILAPVLAGLAAVRRLGRRASPVTTEAILKLTVDLGRQLGLRRSVTLRQATRNDTPLVPMTWGWLRPIVLLPADADDWPQDRLRVVLLHELAHIRRHDWLWQMLAHGVCALYWFHPGVWLVARGLRIESECACDDQVLSVGVPASDYAKYLIEVARSLSQSGAVPRMVMPMATSQIEGRIRAVMQTQGRRNRMTKQTMVLTACMALGVLLPLAAIRPAGKAQAASPPMSAADRARANVRVSAVHAVPGEADAYKLEAEGGRLTPDQAKELERKLAADPNNLLLHIEELGYQNRSAQRFASANTLRDAQVLWLIRTHPDNVLLGSPETYIFPKTDGVAYAEAKGLWLSYADGPSSRTEILGKAAAFLTLNDFPDAETLYLKAEAIDPTNPVWPDRLGHLYQLQESDRHGLTPDYRTWALKALAQYRRVPGSDPKISHNVDVLVDIAKAAYDAGDYDTARACAQRLLELPELDKQSVGMRFFSEGSIAVHEGNMILGRLALRDGDVPQARERLLAMGRISGSSSLSSFGPNMQLAQDMLGHGERQAVLQYFDECGQFWKNDNGLLAQWREAVTSGHAPNFGGNLVY